MSHGGGKEERTECNENMFVLGASTWNVFKLKTNEHINKPSRF